MKVRENRKRMEFKEAINKAVDDCIEEGILKEFLWENKAEAIMVSIFEYNEEEHLKSLRGESVAEGIEVGKELGLKGIVNSLKPYLTNFEELYEAVIKNEGYENITKEQVKQLL